MTLLGDTVRVCPQCGSDPGQDDVCRTCARDLAGLPELPTRSEWLAQPQARSSRRRAARKSVSSGVPPSLRPMLHPTEMSRLILALAVATLTLAVVLFAAIAAHAASVLPLLGGLLFFIVFLAASLWFGQQLLRARLLGQSVKVGADSLPQIHELIEEVKATLHYRRRVDVYVSDKQETPIITTSYLGTRTLILEGDFIAGLLEADKRPQLVFLIGRAIGALRAKHLRLSFVVLLLQGLDILEVPRAVHPPLVPGHHLFRRPDWDDVLRRRGGGAGGHPAAARRQGAGRGDAGQGGPSAGLPRAPEPPAAVHPALPGGAAHDQPLREPPVLRPLPRP